MASNLSNHMISFLMLAFFIILFTKPLIVIASQVPCYFVFGDSYVDPGNNNLLKTIAKANYPPYGIDFPQGIATGRFTNGRTFVDILAQKMGFKEFTPPFVGVFDITQGVNYASGSSGILDDTSRIIGDRYTLNEQMANHQTIVNQFEVLFGTKEGATQYLSKCIYSFTIGSNDYINNYFQPILYNSSRLYTPDSFASLLVQQYSTQLQALYDTGARKVALTGLPPLGPAVLLFNVKLQSLVAAMNKKLPAAKFTFLNTALIGARKNPLNSGVFDEVIPCCIIGGGFVGLTCIPNSIPCFNRGQRAFFDRVHPTEAVNVYYADLYYKKLFPDDAIPYDISQLAQL